MNAPKVVNSILAFVLELLLLYIVVSSGISTRTVVGSIAGIIAVFVIIILWARYAAPRSDKRLPQPYLGLFKLVLFGSGAFTLLVAGHVIYGVIFFIVAIISITFEYFDT
jgi:hypothetical protein